ncbi:MAG TPA: alpha-glucoside ABC transporter permease, partial [Maritimibacter sp.]|nr:alpha-glucoside ABC transporter permease [Maritimibacter sp.]
MQQAIIAVATIIIGVFGCVAYFYFSNLLLDRMLPAKGPNAGRNINRANAIRPWLFVFPALAILSIYL